MRDPFPDADGRPQMSGETLIIGIGNDFRCDDGVGLAVAAAIADRRIAGVRVMTDIGDPASILDAWTGVPLVIAVDAAMGDGATPGRIRRWTPQECTEPTAVSSHTFGLAQAYSLGRALGRLPRQLVVFTVDVADVRPDVGLTSTVAAAVPLLVKAVLAELH
ncbi:hydrogenase maturation protease [Mycolicibacterium frederiksbergense]|nr:hydrogenase maturation protease [Mycolicibacterium frederiksbergense]